LLRAGADISRMPADTAPQRRHRELVLPQYTQVLSGLRTLVMVAVNAALRPQRSLAAFLMKSLPTLHPHLLHPSGTAPLASLFPAPGSHSVTESGSLRSPPTVRFRLTSECLLT